MTEQEKRAQREYEEGWKKKFAARLKQMTEGRGMEAVTLAEGIGAEPARIRMLLAGEDFPTVEELLRICRFCYDPDELFYGARERAFSYFVRGI